MLAELKEIEATGEIAAIYGEIRHFSGVPYVSSLQRHLATRPGWLPWAWTALRPVFASGLAQTTAWGVASRVAVPRLAPVGRAALRVWGVSAADEPVIRAVCEGFIRVAPVNMMLSGLMRLVLGGARPGGRVAEGPAWTPPAAVPPPPALVDLASLAEAERGVLMSLATDVAGTPFVPGLYRMLAGWPGFLAHVATVLRPAFDDALALAARRQLGEAIKAALPAVLDAVPPLPKTPPMPPAQEFAGVMAALDTYRRTSPEMVVFGTMIRDALPT